MGRQLVLIRHTKSSWHDFSISDFERPLQKDRINDAKRMAKKLKDLKLHPDLIVCSPALRTKETVSYFCDKLKYAHQQIQFNERLYESSADEYLSVIRETEPQITSLVIVGHNPSITHFANLFLKAKLDELPTTGVVWFEVENDSWEIYQTTPCSLKYLLTPKTI